MSDASDIANLFGKFGGQAARYQELDAVNRARQSRERWPLLAAVPGAGSEDEVLGQPRLAEIPATVDDGTSVFVPPRPRARPAPVRAEAGLDASRADPARLTQAAGAADHEAPSRQSTVTPLGASPERAEPRPATAAPAACGAENLTRVFARLQGGAPAEPVQAPASVFARLIGARTP